LVALTAILAGGGSAQGAQITGIVSFGDSLSDVGNVYTATGGAQPSPPSSYYQGRYSNGPNWLDYLANDVGVSAPKPSLTGGSDYAYGGAQTGVSGMSAEGTPNIGTQISTYLASNKPSPTQLFTIWGGANDILIAQQTNPAIAAGNIAQEITTLANAGAKQFLIPNLPLLGEIPLTSGMSTSTRQSLDQWSAGFNTILSSEVAQLQKSLGVQIHTLDIQGLVQNAMANPAQYGFTNVTSPGMNTSQGGNGYLFWDQEHPTTGADLLIASDAAQAVVPEPGSLVIFGAGLCAIAAWRARRRHPASAAPAD
jgi:phospholipase/lecithinase/hemolysin